jgi:hypothetical protein
MEVTADGDGPTHLTTHQLVVRRENVDDDMGDWCKDNLRVSSIQLAWPFSNDADDIKKILDRCVKEGEGYVGYLGVGNGLSTSQTL